ncbi:DUF221 domain containing protein [Trichuris trichiura]|uniref:DUF221 domain containing protein n=1 Tax=Trichuris trichiura TaxID=36087 RepID=A0A077ZER8_TRITR|nr:DUF221 domain containing protein [Trichuris trichiura]
MKAEAHRNCPQLLMIRSQLLLVHVVATIFFFLLAVSYVKEAETDLKKKQYETPSRTVMITNIPGEIAGNLLAIGLYFHVKSMFGSTRKYGGKTFGDTPTSKYEVKLKPTTWQARMAPAASNIFWHNFGVRFWAIKALLWNSFLFFMLFFLTTPSMAVNLWFKMGHTIFGFSPPENPPWQRALSVLTLMVFTYFLPMSISFAESNNSHWTKSRLQKAILRKTYVFLLFMILILPSLGLNSGYNFFVYILQPQHVHLRWSCIFMPDNSAFYVNYIITGAFLAKTAELLRLDNLIYHVYQRMACRSKFEFNAALQNSVFEFGFGVEYAHMLAIFSTIIAYSVINPLIAPSGKVFLT